MGIAFPAPASQVGIDLARADLGHWDVTVLLRQPLPASLLSLVRPWLPAAALLAPGGPEV